jgi:hypothetical protein
VGDALRPQGRRRAERMAFLHRLGTGSNISPAVRPSPGRARLADVPPDRRRILCSLLEVASPVRPIF